MPEPVYASRTSRHPTGRLPLHDLGWGLAALTLVVALAWLGLLSPDDDTEAAPAPPARADGSATPVSGRQHAEPAPAPAAPGAAAAPAAASAQPATAALDNPAEVEVCGYGRVALPSDDPNPLQRMPAALRHAALAQAESHHAGSYCSAEAGRSSR